ncbi:DUF1769 family protein [Schizosaccharomyces cryophilus OY26]|uniref:DUF1769 family protein n=1 Tax=Schizosaccharomyces cryophilus (strain OY26 / ATCC MYA-4695 / CBS 11777 / NBRC 106824 / NRRL Y48691) TaxID=653667 RepID=S9VTB8_SCHCR|nr:DUF1769 family protein [Schizosaccharomyces cryophilus OY26]EPY49359.1 DUF1769 family protein [Schizosaccharomyces cryophilus OY26]
MKCFLVVGSRKEAIAINGPPNVVKSKQFEGQIKVRLRDYEVQDHEYFSKSNDTCSIMIAGHFVPTESVMTADDILFGNQFDKPLRDVLPAGSSYLMKCLKLVDPALEYDLYSDQPWAFSPFYSTMTKMKTANTQLPLEYFDEGSSNRKKEMLDPENRQKLPINPSRYFVADFCNPFFDPSSMSISIPYTKLKFSIQSYYSGQPLRYVCKTRTDEPIFAIEFDL